jgi:lipopolysaccharide/colanic/teichoic acid biosynthesis glycosyltransferase
MARRVESDLWYIANWSLWLDIKILFRTVGVITHVSKVY